MAQVSMAAIPALKDSFVQLKTRMDKAVEDFRKEMTSTRTGRLRYICWTVLRWMPMALRCR